MDSRCDKLVRLLPRFFGGFLSSGATNTPRYSVSPVCKIFQYVDDKAGLSTYAESYANQLNFLVFTKKLDFQLFYVMLMERLNHLHMQNSFPIRTDIYMLKVTFLIIQKTEISAYAELSACCRNCNRKAEISTYVECLPYQE